MAPRTGAYWFTKAVVARRVVLFKYGGVGAVGVPVNAGLTRPPAAVASTKAVVASCVLFVPVLAVGAVGTPVRAGEVRGA